MKAPRYSSVVSASVLRGESRQKEKSARKVKGYESVSVFECLKTLTTSWPTAGVPFVGNEERISKGNRNEGGIESFRGAFLMGSFSSHGRRQCSPGIFEEGHCNEAENPTAGYIWRPTFELGEIIHGSAGAQSMNRWPPRPPCYESH
ncbi:hypothetical protein KM043_002173 [Ampulex compressa]|nr:hypothetical protein KM043_002173 [Ampulex compressa]